MPSRRVLFILLVAGCLAGGAVAVASGVRSSRTSGGSTAGASRALAADVRAGRPALVYRSLHGSTGELAVASLGGGTTPGKPTLSGLNCQRVYYAAGHGLCLAPGGSLGAEQVEVLGPDLRVQGRIAVPGIPSRARVSPDGRYGSVTFFVAGHAYAAPGSFSTQTTLIDLAHATKIADLETFDIAKDGRQVTASDINLWGVTFARDGDRFYATLATGGHTYLIQGSVSGRTARVLHENVECPSLSPDGTRIAYKHRTASSARPWRLYVLDLATMHETPLAETASVDDQAEWLDDRHVLYGRDGAIWEVPADGSGQPRRLVAGAESPAVVRPGV